MPYMTLNMSSLVSGPFLQGEALARVVLPVQKVPHLPGGQAVRVQGGPDLLRLLLRFAVRHPM